MARNKGGDASAMELGSAEEQRSLLQSDGEGAPGSSAQVVDKDGNVGQPGLFSSMTRNCCRMSKNPVSQIIMAFGCCLSSVILSILLGVAVVAFVLSAHGVALSDVLYKLLHEFIQYEWTVLVAGIFENNYRVTLFAVLAFALLNTVCFWLYRFAILLPHVEE
eukprot:TRINITY_DN17807_c0_g1_i1.p1 TRINITY_DN17807_c0_g1~~TRINITY_DN17807_c0_g1_i1.p1  ORF type:complete len:163 (+),score=46.57 TRINITY_DN17807_c0_g1_i1:129-617(+)